MGFGKCWDCFFEGGFGFGNGNGDEEGREEERGGERRRGGEEGNIMNFEGREDLLLSLVGLG